MLALGAVCWVFRVAFIAVVPAERLPARVRDGLVHLAPSVLAALVAIELSGLASAGSAATGALVLAAAAAVALAARRTGNLLLAIGVASVCVLLIDLVLPA
jgi:branched-subunit amino acid transport protein